MLLESVLRGSASPAHVLTVFQSSAAQSSLPLLRSFLTQTQTDVVLCSLLYPPKVLVNELRRERVHIVDCTADIPSYGDVTCTERILSAVRAVNSSQPLTVVIDSLETLLSNLHSKAAVYAFLSELQTAIADRPASRLVAHALTPSALPILALITTPSFSPSLVHITAHQPALLTHLALSLSTPPPPLSPPEKFWNVFLPIASRTFDIEDLAFGSAGEGSGAGNEIVAEVLVRGDVGDGRRRKGVERTLEGWVVTNGEAVELKDLPSLKSIYTGKTPSAEVTSTPDPTQNLSFNLTLTAEQQQSKTQVPLPYAHTGAASTTPQTSAILYDPDSADDIDDDDPDEDLDI